MAAILTDIHLPFPAEHDIHRTAFRARDSILAHNHLSCDACCVHTLYHTPGRAAQALLPAAYPCVDLKCCRCPDRAPGPPSFFPLSLSICSHRRFQNLDSGLFRVETHRTPMDTFARRNWNDVDAGFLAAYATVGLITVLSLICQMRTDQRQPVLIRSNRFIIKQLRTR